MQVSIPTISITDALKEDAIYIDVRSPKEYEEFHIPNAVSIPLFTNDERARVGTIYKQVGQGKAIEVGVEIFSKKLPQLFEQYRQIVHENHNRKIIVYCWRGGMRSGTIVSFLGMIKQPLIQLEGGIRSYRKLIQAGLKAYSEISKKYIVLEGNTGTHKTDILHVLQQENYPVLDLEGLADHRGSTFGGIGLKPKSQKEFERDLLLRLEELKDSPYVIIEAESKRIGRIVIPDFILEGKDEGTRIHIHAPIESRVKAICDTYRFADFHDQFENALEIIQKRMKPDLYNKIMDSLQKCQYEEFVTLLLEEYYDPKYTFAADQYNTPVRSVSIEGVKDGVEIIKAEINFIMDNLGLLTT